MGSVVTRLLSLGGVVSDQDSKPDGIFGGDGRNKVRKKFNGIIQRPFNGPGFAIRVPERKEVARVIDRLS